MDSNFGLKLRLRLPKWECCVLASGVVAPDVKQFDEAGEMLPFTLGRDHRRPAMFVIFGIDVAAVIARSENVDASRGAVVSERVAHEYIGSAKAVIDPPQAIVGKTHFGPALKRLGIQFGAGP